MAMNMDVEWKLVLLVDIFCLKYNKLYIYLYVDIKLQIFKTNIMEMCVTGYSVMDNYVHSTWKSKVQLSHILQT